MVAAAVAWFALAPPVLKAHRAEELLRVGEALARRRPGTKQSTHPNAPGCAPGRRGGRAVEDKVEGRRAAAHEVRVYGAWWSREAARQGGRQKWAPRRRVLRRGGAHFLLLGSRQVSARGPVLWTSIGTWRGVKGMPKSVLSELNPSKLRAPPAPANPRRAHRSGPIFLRTRACAAAGRWSEAQ